MTKKTKSLTVERSSSGYVAWRECGIMVFTLNSQTFEELHDAVSDANWPRLESHMVIAICTALFNTNTFTRLTVKF